MQNTKMSTGEYVLFSIPVDMLEEAGIGEESVVQMRAGNGKIIINTVSDTDDFICDSDCEHCPMSETDCDENCETAPTQTALPETPPSVTEKSTEPPVQKFDINYWINYAKRYAQSVGLHLDSTATDCWDNPIPANAQCKYLERDIQNRLNRYASDDDITSVWIWAEKIADNSYEIYIGYA